MSYDFEQRVIRTTVTGDSVRTAPAVCSSPKCGCKLWYYRKITAGVASGRIRVSCDKCKRFVGYVVPQQTHDDQGRNLDGTIKKKRRKNSKESRFGANELYT